MKQTVLTPAENLRLQARYLPELVKCYAHAQQEKSVQKAEDLSFPRKRVVLCENSAALLRANMERPLFRLPPDSALWQELEMLGSVPLYLRFCTALPRLECTGEEAVLSGNGCWLKNQFPVVLMPGPALRDSPLLKDAAVVYAVRPLSHLERRRLQQTACSVMEVSPEELPGLLEDHHGYYPPDLLPRLPQRIKWSGAPAAPWDTVAVPEDFRQVFSRLSQPRGQRVWTSDLLLFAQEQFAEVFFKNLGPALASNEPIELRFTRSYLAVELYGLAERRLTQSMVGKAGACVERMSASKEQINRQAAFTRFLEQINQEIGEQIPKLQKAIWNEWGKLEWWK